MGFFRGLLAFVIGWLMVRMIRSIANANKAASERMQKKQQAKELNALEMVRCPSCGVFTSGPCENTNCAKEKVFQ